MEGKKFKRLRELLEITRFDAKSSDAKSFDTKIEKEGVYPSARHLNPDNIRSLRESLDFQLQTLRQATRVSAPLPPFIHRPESRYFHSGSFDQKET